MKQIDGLLEKENFLLLKENMRLGRLGDHILEQHRMEPVITRISSIDTALALAVLWNS